MTDISAAIEELEKEDIEAFEHGGILNIPCPSPDDIVSTVSKVKKILNRIDYHKSWLVDPYFYDKRGTNTEEN